MTPALPEDIDILSRPVTYVTYQFRATDGKPHDVQVYFDASGELTVNTSNQQVTWSTEKIGRLTALKIGSTDQPILAKRGDDIRIDWGYLYVAAPEQAVSSRVFAARGAAQNGFIKASVEALAPQPPAAADGICAAMTLQVGEVSEKPVSRWLMLAYDDLYSIQYMKKNLRPYWRRNGWEAADLLKAAAKDYGPLRKRCIAFDEELMSDLAKAGGEKYAKLAALAYRGGQVRRRRQWAADLVLQGEPFQWLHRHFRRVLPDGAAVPALGAIGGQVVPRALHELCGQ
jgi:hypothetical protein